MSGRVFRQSRNDNKGSDGIKAEDLKWVLGALIQAAVQILEHWDLLSVYGVLLRAAAAARWWSRTSRDIYICTACIYRYIYTDRLHIWQLLGPWKPRGWKKFKRAKLQYRQVLAERKGKAYRWSLSTECARLRIIIIINDNNNNNDNIDLVQWRL